MELSVTQENFSRALSAVGRVASNKTGLPILNNILLRTDGNRLLVAATNLEIATTQYIGAKIVKAGAITVPAKLIAEFVGSLPKDSIELKVVNENLHIKSGKLPSTRRLMISASLIRKRTWVSSNKISTVSIVSTIVRRTS